MTSSRRNFSLILYGTAIATALFNAGANAGSPMELPGSFAVSSFGQFTYSIPIEVPPGTAAIVPALSLSYTSGTQNGILGVGWSLIGLPTITRCAPTIAQDGTVVTGTSTTNTSYTVMASSGVTLTGADDYCYAGSKLFAVSSTMPSEGAHDHEYRTEIDSYTRLVRHASGSTAQTGAGAVPSWVWWEAWTKSGEHIEFGGTSDSAVQNTNVVTTPIIVSWTANRVSDSSGNYMTVAYSQNTSTGETHPTEIDYTGNNNGTPNVAPYNSVKFVYGQGQPKTIINYQAGSETTTSVLLTDIETFTGTGSSGSLVSDYRLTYSTSSSKRALLSSLTRCDSVGCSTYGDGTSFAPQNCVSDKHCLAPTSFTYNSGGELAIAQNIPGGATSNGVCSKGSLSLPYSSTYDSSSARTLVEGYEAFLGDFDGSGRQSILWVSPLDVTGGSSYPNVCLWINQGSGSFTMVPGPSAPFTGSVPAAPHVVDLNGDGKADIIWFGALNAANAPSRYVAGGPQTDFNGKATIWLSTGGGNFTTSTIDVSSVLPTNYSVASAPYSYQAYLADINGDGLPDIVIFPLDKVYNGGATHISVFSPDQNYNYTIVCFNNGDGTFRSETISWPSNSKLVSSGGVWTPHFADFNGDGRSDIFWDYENSYASNGQYYLWSGNGDGSFTVKGVSATDSAGVADTGVTNYTPLIGTFGGDGNAGILWMPINGSVDTSLSSGPPKIWVGHGDGNFTLQASPIGTLTSFNNWKPYVADFQGLGRADILWDNETPCEAPTSPTCDTSTGTQKLWLSNNDGTFRSVGVNQPMPGGGNSSQGWRPFIGDFDGDGKADVLWDLQSASSNNTYVIGPYVSVGQRALWLSDGIATDTLNQFTTGLGAANLVNYATLASQSNYTKGSGATYPIQDVQNSMKVVQSIVMDAGLSDNSTTFTTTYSYKGAKQELDGRGFLGFQEKIATAPANLPVGSATTGSTIGIYSHYLTQFPCTGLTWQTLKIDTSQVLSASAYTPSSQRLLTSDMAYSVNGGAGTITTDAACSASVSAAPYQVLTGTVTTSEADLDGTSMGSTTTSYLDANSLPLFDSFGDPLSAQVIDNDKTGTYQKVTTNAYLNDTVDWFIGRTVCSQTTDTVTPVGGAAVQYIRTAGNLYDSRGLIAKSIVEPAIADADILSSAATIGATIKNCAGSELVAVTSSPYAYERLETDYDTSNGFGVRDQFGNATITTVIPTQGNTEPGTPPNRVTTTKFDHYGRLPLSVTKASGTSVAETTSYCYNSACSEASVPFNEVWSSTDPSGLVTNATFDGLGRQTLSQPPDGWNIATNYLWCSGVNGGTSNCPTNGAYSVSVTSQWSDGTQLAPTKSVTHDRLDRQIAADVQSFSGTDVSRTATAYDAMMRTASVSLPYLAASATPERTTYVYDDLGRALSVTTPDQCQTTTQYSGLTETVTNCDNEITQPTRNRRGDNVSVVDALTNTTTMTPGPFRTVVAVTDPGNNVTSYNFDARGNRISVVDPDAGTLSTAWNSFGETVGGTNAAGQRTVIMIDVLGRQTQRSEVSLTSSWVYTPSGSGSSSGCIGYLDTSTSSDQSYSQIRVYDSSHYCRLSKLTYSLGGGALIYVVVPHYDAYGRLIGYTYPDGLVVGCKSTAICNPYNSTGYPTQTWITAPGNSTPSSFLSVKTEDAFFNPTESTTGDGQVSNRGYDVMGRMKTVQTSGSSGTAQDLVYGYDMLGNITSRQDNVLKFTESYQYDGLNRLTQSALSESTGSAISYEYDAIGNMTWRSDFGKMVYGTSGTGGVNNGKIGPHQLQSSTVEQESPYLATLNTGTQRSYSFNSFNMPAVVIEGASSSPTIIFSYDDQHRRINVFDYKNGISGWYIWGDGFYLMQENGTWHDYIFFGGKLVGEYVNGSTSQALYYHEDGQGTVTSVTGTGLASPEQDSYEPFGKRRNRNASADTTCTVGSAATRGFIGQEQLGDDVCLINLNARLYDPLTTRFISADPVGLAGGSNLYAYSDNSPLDKSDPTGLTGCVPSPCQFVPGFAEVRKDFAWQPPSRNLLTRTGGLRIAIAPEELQALGLSNVNFDFDEPSSSGVSAGSAAMTNAAGTQDGQSGTTQVAAQSNSPTANVGGSEMTPKDENGAVPSDTKASRRDSDTLSGRLENAEWNGDTHEDAKNALADDLKAKGLVVETEVHFILNGTEKGARADLVAMIKNVPATLTAIEVKTGPGARLTDGQMWVYPSIVHGENLVSGIDNKIKSFGFAPGQPLPPAHVLIWYERSPMAPVQVIQVPPVIPFEWRPTQ